MYLFPLKCDITHSNLFVFASVILRTKHGKIIHACSCTTSYVLNFEVTELDITKLLLNVQK